MNYDACIKKSIEFIEDNLDKKIELEELADKVFLSKFHFHRKFHAATGEPVAEYIRKKRLDRAAKDLIYTDEKIIDISLKYQFGSQEAFTKAFKKFYGVPPREFRRNKNHVTIMPSASKASVKLSMAA